MAQTNRIILKNLKVARFMSKETLAYEALVFFDGECCGTAENNGQGGCTFIRAKPGTQFATLAKAEAWARTLPAEVTDMDDPKEPGKKFEYRPDFDSLVDDVANEMDIDRSLQSSFKRSIKKIVYLENGKIYTVAARDKTKTLTPQFLSLIKSKHPTATILNEMPVAEAFEIYKKAVSA